MAAELGNILIKIGANVATLQADMAKAVGVMGKAEREFKKIGNNLKATLGAALSIAGIEKFVSVGLSLAEVGDKADDISDAFKRLGGSSQQIEKASAASLGMVKSSDLMAIANKALLAQAPEIADNFGEIADLGARVADTLGIDTKQGIENLTNAIIKAKPKQLEQYGIYLDTNKALKEYADKHGIAYQKVSDLTKILGPLEQKEAARLAVLKQIPDALARMGPITDSVANSTKRLTETIADIEEKIGSMINNNPELIQQLNELNTSLKAADWQGIAMLMGNVIALVVDLADKLVYATNSLYELWKAFHPADAAAMEMAKAAQKTDSFNTAIVELGKKAKAAKTQEELDRINKAAFELGDTLAKTPKEAAPVMGFYGNLARLLHDLDKTLPHAARGTGDLSDKAQELAEKFAQARGEWEKTANDIENNSLKQSIQGAVESLNSADFNNLIEQFRKNVAEGVDLGLREKLEKGIITKEEAARAKETMIANAIDPIMQNWKDQSAKVIKETEEKQKEAFETTANFFADVFLSAMEGTMPDLENIFKQIASGFAGAIASAVTRINFGGNFQQLGISLGAQALEIGGTAGGAGLGAGLLSGGAGLLGSAGFSMSGSAAAAAEISGPANAAGMFVQPGSGVLGAVGPAMPYVAAALAVYAGLEHFGVFDNKKHPETQARKDVINYLESKLGKNFVLGDSGKFNDGKGFEFLNGLDNKTKNTFSAMGEGLTRFLGITEDVGPQIGAILAENFTGNLDEAKMMLGELGISMEDMTNSVIDFGLQADQSLLQIQQNVAGIEEAFKPGKAAVGDFAGAFEDFTKSSNKGIKATTAIKNVAIESIEAGMTKIEQLKPKLEALFPREQVEKFFQAMSAFGITDLQQLADASDRTLIAVGAHIEALGFQFDKLVDSVKQTVAEINKLSAATSRIDVPTTTPVGGIPQMAKGGIFSKATLGIFGEAGPEAILPLTRVGGVLGVRSVGGGGGQVVFQIDARGAAPGVENTIMNAIKQAKDEAINTAVRAVQGMRTSNPSYGRIFDE